MRLVTAFYKQLRTPDIHIWKAAKLEFLYKQTKKKKSQKLDIETYNCNKIHQKVQLKNHDGLFLSFERKIGDSKYF